MKSIKISDSLHFDLKLFCVKNKFSITKFVEELIKEKIKSDYISRN